MSHKRVVEKSGKSYGPYLYESYRDADGTVKKRYLGKVVEQQKRSIYVLAIVVAILLTLILFSSFSLTGRATFSLENIAYDDGVLSGFLLFTLQQSELLPADTQVVIDNGEQHSFSLGELIDNILVDGDFFVVQNEISGSGSGYGVDAERFPAVSFVLGIYSEVEEVEENETEEPSNGTRSITGMVSLELVEEVEGEVRANESFVYDLEEGQSAELISSDKDVELSVENDQAIITTSYTGDEIESVEIDLDELNISVEEGDLVISFIYDEVELFSESIVVEFEDVVEDNESVVEEEPVQENESSNESGVGGLTREASATCPNGMSGDGDTSETACLINSCADLESVVYVMYPDPYYYKLNQDIDCGSYGTFTPIGTGYEFGGNFNGNYKIITGLTVNTGVSGYAGLFSYTRGAIIYNLGLEDVSVSGSGLTGGLVGHASSLYGAGTIIDNVYTTGVVNGGFSYDQVGGLVGYLDGSSIDNSYSLAEVSGGDYVGGLVGNNGGDISNSYSFTYYSFSPYSPYGSDDVGGIAGVNWGTIEYSFAVSAPYASSTSDHGVIVGNNYGTIGYCDYYDWDNFLSCVGVGSSGSTCDSQSSESYFQGDVYPSNDPMYYWDFSNTWKEESGSPSLKGFSPPACVAGMTGENTILNPCWVTSCTQLQAIETDLSGNFALLNNINCNGFGNFNPFGCGASSCGTRSTSTYFTGTFDGNDFNISDMYIDRPSEQYIGLFGYADGAEIHNVRMENVSFKGSNFVGGLIGRLDNGEVYEVYATGIVNSTSNAGGGLAGRLDYSDLNDSYSEVEVIVAGAEAGGLVGDKDYGNIEGSYATGNVSGGGNEVGGLAGENDGNINNSYATGDVAGTNYVGGLIGNLKNGGNIDNSYSTGNVGGSDKVGGLIGQNDIGTVTNNSYATGNVNGSNNVGGLIGQNWNTIYNSYSTGNVSSSGSMGGFAGYNWGTISDSYWYNRSQGLDCSENGNAGCTAETTESYFFDVANSPMSGWDYSIWDNFCDDSGYPPLDFQSLSDVSECEGYSPIPVTTEFGIEYGTTNFSALGDFSTVTNLTLATQYGKIQFPVAYSVDASGANYDTHVEVGSGFISVDTASLDTTFNSSANVTINNVNCPATIYYGSGTYASASSIVEVNTICDSTSDPNCTNIDCTDGNLTFTVSHFTGFASSGSANLTIWDETETDASPYSGEIRYVGEQTKFFANYTNSSGPMSDATCIINFTDSADNEMDWNSSGFYDYNRSFSTLGIYDWNVSCNRSGYSTLTTNDTVVINSSCVAGMTGQNTVGDPCLVTTCIELQNMSLDLDGNFALNNTIDCSNTPTWNSGAGFDPIGDSSTAFSGTFDGRNNTISELFINRTGESYVGLFGKTSDANVSNVGLVNINVTGNDRVGGLSGASWDFSGLSYIISSYSSGNVQGASTYVGGLVGDSFGYVINNSYSSGNVQGASTYVGGLVGGLTSSEIDNSYSVGNVSGNNLVGGLTGNLNTAAISNSYSTGNVSGTSNVGGLVGGLLGTITNSNWYNRSQGLDCYDGGNTNCTAIDNLDYFYYVANEPMDVWSYPPWYNNYGISYPTLFASNESPICVANMSGKNTTSNPCLITDCIELQNMSLDLTGNYALGNDINCSDTVNWNSGSGFDPIGQASPYFTGSFDGQNNTITDLYINRTGESYVGLFGQTSNSNISNVGLIDVNISGNFYVGGLAGSTSNTNIDGVYTTGNVSANNGQVGGLVGLIAGSGYYVNNSYSTANVYDSVQAAGGLIGEIQSGSIYNSYATGNVTGADSVGGLVGYLTTANANITNSYSTGNVSGSTNVGGLFGYEAVSTNVVNSYWYNRSQVLNCTGNAGNPAGCTAETNESYFFDVSNEPLVNWSYPPWDNFCSSYGYPSLEWQNVTDVTNCEGVSLRIEELILNSTDGSNFTDQDLTCWVEALEPNGDNVYYDGHWYRDGTRFISQELNLSYGPGGSEYDEASGIAVDSSGYIYVVGEFNSPTTDWITFKYYPNGTEVWNETFDSAGVSTYDSADAVAVDDSGNVYVTGFNGTLGTGAYQTIKYNSTGGIVWEKSYHSGSGDSFARGVAVDDSGNVYVTGQRSSSDYYTIKYNSAGGFVWGQPYNSGGSDVGEGIAVDSGGYVYVTGTANNNYHTIKHWPSGGTVWAKTYNGGSTDNARAIAIDDSGNVYVTGGSNNGTVNNYYTIKYDSDGDEIWNATYNSPYNSVAEGIAVDSFGNVYVTGYDYVGVGSDYSWLTIKYDSDGNVVWNKTYESGNWYDAPQAIAIDDLGNVYATGTRGTQSSGGGAVMYTAKYYGGILLNNQTEGTLINISTLDSSYTSLGDNWSCSVAAYNGEEYTSYSTSSLTILESGGGPTFSEFGIEYGTTNFSALSFFNNVTNMTLATQYGKIQFPDTYEVDARNDDYDTHIEIGDGFVSVNSSALDTTFNSTANVTINDVNCPAIIYYGSSTYVLASDIIDESNICNETSDPNCTLISCDGNLTFTVSHFTGFASAGSTNLTIWDDTDSEGGSQTKYVNEQVKFFANYTNSTGPIDGADCIINFSGSTDNSMDWNSSGFYEYNRSFSSGGTYDWNVSCNRSGYDALIATDNVTINNTAPNDSTPEINSTDGSNYTNQSLHCFDTITDDDGDSMNVSVKWYKNGGLNSTIDYNDTYANGTSFDAILSSGNTTAFENWSCEMRLYDGVAYSPYNTSVNLTILNFVPTHTKPILNSTDGSDETSQNLTVHNQSTFDLDGHDVKNIIDWRKDGNSTAILNLPFENNFTGSWSLRDYSTYENNATENSGASWNATGGYDGRGAYEFDGTGYLSVFYDDSILIEDENFSVSAYLKYSTPSVARPIVGLWGSHLTNGKSHLLNIGADDFLRFYLHNGTDADKEFIQYNVSGLVSAGQWNHFAATFNVNTKNVTLYMNGSVVNSTIFAIKPQDGTSTSIEIGRQNAAQYLTGTVDEVMMFDSLLSSEQISAIYNNGTDLIVSQETSNWEVWQACVTPNDGYVDGLENCSNNLTIYTNEVPIIEQLFVNTSTGLNLTTDDLMCWANATDANGDNLDYTGTWYKDGEKQYNSFFNFTFGWGTSDDSRALGIDSQDNIISLGYTNVNGDGDVLIVKFSSNGTPLWSKIIDDGSTEIGDALYVDGNDNIFVAHSLSTLNDALIKYNSTGGVLWNVNVSHGSYGSSIHDLTIDSNGDLILVGNKDFTGTGKPDFWVLKYNATNGSQIWEKTFTHAVNIVEIAYAVVTDSSNNIYFTGSLGNTDGIPVLKLNSAGTLSWKKTFKKAVSGDTGWGITLDSQERPVITGRTASTNSDVWTFKLDTSGNSLWNATIGGSGNDQGRDIVKDSNDNFFVSASTDSYGEGFSDFWFLGYNSSGSLIMNTTFGGSGNEGPSAGGLDSKENIILAGSTTSFGAGGSDVFIAKYHGFELNNQTEGVLVNVSTLDSSYTSPGENWSCEVQAYDGASYSTLNMSNNLTIYAAPVIQQLIFNSTDGTNYTSEDLTCWANATDLDGDNVSYRGFWYVNGDQHFEFWNLSVDEGIGDRAYGVAIDSQDNIISAGGNFETDREAWAAKYYPNGTQIWSNIYGNSSDDDEFYDVIVDSNDSIIATGWMRIGDTAGNFWTIKLYPNGTQIWNESFGQIGIAEYAEAVDVDSEDNIVVAGREDSIGDAIVVKYYSNGTQIWNTTIDNGAIDGANGVSVDSNDDIIIVGFTNLSGSVDVWTVKLNSSGSILWNETISGPNEDVGEDVTIDSNDSIILTGYMEDAVSDKDYLVAKYNSSGTLIWNVTISESNDDDQAQGVAVDSEDNIFVTGYIYNAGEMTIKLDPDGNQIWNKTFGNDQYDAGRSIALDSYDDIIISGQEDGDFLIMKYYRFNLENQTEGVLVNVSTLDSSETSAGDNWSCSVNAFDGVSYSDLNVSNNLTVTCVAGMEGLNTIASPCLVTNCSELQNMSLDLDGNFGLNNSINCSDTVNWNGDAGFEPIGEEASAFVGTFDGMNYIITDLFIDRTGEDDTGLFGFANTSNLSSVGLENVNVSGKDSVGGLSGVAYLSQIDNSYVTGAVYGDYSVGGLSGVAYKTQIDNSYANVSVSSSSIFVGGLSGFLIYGDIDNSYARGDVDGGAYVGGFVGYNVFGNIDNSYATGNVSGSAKVGGLVGETLGGNINASYATGNVSGSSDIGGLLGALTSTLLNSTYWYDRGYGLECYPGGGEDDCTEITNEEYFFDAEYVAPMDEWDFDNIWERGSYPVLWWQGTGNPLPAGSGTLADPFNITDCYELQAMKYNLTAYYDVINNVNCSNTYYWNFGVGFNPVGNDTTEFTGTFDGRNNTITDLFIDRPSESYVGLFGYVDGSEIQSVGISDADITGDWNVGALAGYLTSTNVNATYSTGSVTGASLVGGLVGENDASGLINNSYSTATVTGSGVDIGGLVGYHYQADIDNSYSAGNVSGTMYVGGLVGGAQALGGGTIDNSYATGNVSGSSYVGGLIGQNVGETVDNAYWYNRSQGLNCIGFDGGSTTCTGITNEEYFFNVSNGPLVNWSYPPWDSFCNTSGYPTLEWQNINRLRDCLGFVFYLSYIKNSTTTVKNDYLEGNLTNTTLTDTDDSIGLSGSNTSGEYVSQVFNFNSTGLWNNISWSEEIVNDSGWKDISVGTSGWNTPAGHTCGIMSNGTAYCWGNNFYGELGNGAAPYAHNTNANPIPVNINSTFKKIVAGGYFTCGILTNGTAYCWGYGQGGRLGTGNEASQSNPSPVNTTETFKDISASYTNACGITNSGIAYCWGQNTYGQLGNGSVGGEAHSPVAVYTTANFTKISMRAGSTWHGQFVCGLSTNGTAYCWGWNDQGQLGNGSVGGEASIPVAVNISSTFSDLTTGWSHACGILTNGTAYCWGEGSAGALGDWNVTTNDEPNPVAVALDEEFSNISAGKLYTCGILTNGTAYCWGFGADPDGHGKLGFFTTSNEVYPLPVNISSTFKHISAMWQHTCGLSTNGTAYCWGRNDRGELGNGDTTIRWIPTPVNNSGSSDIASSINMSTRLSTDGSSWGSWTSVSNPDDITATGSQNYIQYRAIFNTNFSESPKLFNVTVEYGIGCGDGECNGAEDCSSCETDCGVCAGGDTGGSGGCTDSVPTCTSESELSCGSEEHKSNCAGSCDSVGSLCSEGSTCTNDVCVVDCVENWTCDDWSECVDSIWTRTCDDSNNCGTEDDKPDESDSCEPPACVPDWQCVWSECDGIEEFSFPDDCSDVMDCGTPEPEPKSCDVVEQEKEQEAAEAEGSDVPTCTSSWSCESWGECESDYTLEDVLDDNVDPRGTQRRVCTDTAACRADKIDKKPCSVAIPVEATRVEWCDETYVEIYDKTTDKLVSRIKERKEVLATKEIERIDISLITTEFTGYCDYCYNGVKDPSEEQVDCGGDSCPECIEKKEFFDWYPWATVFLLASVAMLTATRVWIDRHIIMFYVRESARQELPSSVGIKGKRVIPKQVKITGINLGFADLIKNTFRRPHKLTESGRSNISTTKTKLGSTARDVRSYSEQRAPKPEMTFFDKVKEMFKPRPEPKVEKITKAPSIQKIGKIYDTRVALRGGKLNKVKSSPEQVVPEQKSTFFSKVKEIFKPKIEPKVEKITKATSADKINKISGTKNSLKGKGL